MSDNCLFIAGGVLIKWKFNTRAKNGTFTITEGKEVELYDDQGELIDRSSLDQTEIKFNAFSGDTIKINGHKWMFALVPVMKIGLFSRGGVVAGMEHGMRDDVKEANRKREELQKLLEDMQTNK